MALQITGASRSSSSRNLTLIPTVKVATTRVLSLTDRDKNLENTANITIVIPDDSFVDFEIGSQIFFTKKFDSLIFAHSTSVTVNSVDGLLEMGRINCGASLLKIGADEWNLIGELV
jgi:hypothetical protein